MPRILPLGSGRGGIAGAVNVELELTDASFATVRVVGSHGSKGAIHLGSAREVSQ
jgi:hypothetical protein